ncbi:MAG: T9SS type A sorting domain-containing protein [Flavobacteriales bacterium]|nr:T9SS type A sorting domain-containing protein [Flavobacteriales bacterium]
MRSIHFFLLVAISLSSHAQLWERADQRSEVIQLTKVLPMGGGRWAVIGYAEWGSPMISVRNADGSIAWEQVDNISTGQGFGDVVFMPDSGLLHVGAVDGCDYMGPESRVRRYSPDGSVLWERTIEPLFTYPPTMAAQGSIGQVAVASSDSVYIMDLDGNSTGGFQVTTPDILRIAWAGDSALFMIRTTDLMLVDLEGNVLASTSIGPMVADLHWNGQELFMLSNDSVRRFSSDLVPIGIAALPDLDQNSTFTASENGLFVTTAACLYQLAANGTPTLLFPWPALPNHGTTACAIRNGTVLSIGHTNISGRSTGIIRTLSMIGDAPQYDQDVEVLLQVDSTWTEFVGGIYPWNRHAYVTGFVVNHGPDTLHSVVLSMWVQVPYLFCGPHTNRIDTSGFALTPGDTLSLPFGGVQVQLGLQQSQAEGAGEICIVALAPDLLADRAPEDNTACASVDYVLGVEEPKRKASLSLAPNPATSTCMLSGLGALDAPLRLTIMDPTGRMVAEHSSEAASDNIQLDISGLPPATYIFIAAGVRNRAVLKLVVARN